MRQGALLAGSLALAIGLVALNPARAPAAPPAPDGAAVYARCAACHTKTGAGVPGAYPPLGIDFRTLAANREGRRYLALVVIKGQMGPITVEGKPYRGVMPAQAGLNDAAIAAVLNHIGTKIAMKGPAFKPFAADEIGKARASGSGLSAADVAKLHAAGGGR